MICRIFPCILIVAISIVSADYSCPEPTRELKLSIHDPDVVRFAQDAWNEFKKYRSDCGHPLSQTEISWAAVLVVAHERRYTIVASYRFDDSVPYEFECLILVQTERSDPLLVACSKIETINNKLVYNKALTDVMTYMQRILHVDS
ncbi:Protein of unknown function [Cotesia congregata]|uniref:Uncharacterized protein n=1 Tax=Cotesia congregata TaxID=51543 RepID=A0A8J2H871_COTCN|nr:Protein of unknown function [Cotesia congregata]